MILHITMVFGIILQILKATWEYIILQNHGVANHIGPLMIEVDIFISINLLMNIDKNMELNQLGCLMIVIKTQIIFNNKITDLLILLLIIQYTVYFIQTNNIIYKWRMRQYVPSVI